MQARNQKKTRTVIFIFQRSLNNLPLGSTTMFDQTGQEHRHLQNRNHVFSTFLFKLSFRALKLNPSSKNEDKSPQKGCHFPRSFFWCSKFKPFFLVEKNKQKHTKSLHAPKRPAGRSSSKMPGSLCSSPFRPPAAPPLPQRQRRSHRLRPP